MVNPDDIILLELATPAVQGEPVAHTFYILHDATEGQKYIKKDVDDGCLQIFEREEDAQRAKRRHPGTEYKRVDYYTAPQPVEQQPAPVFSDEDHVSMPRGLIAAACSAIDKKRDAENVLSELRRYTLGDLSRQTEPDVSALVDALEEIAKWTERWTAPDHPITTVARKAIAAHRKQGSEV